MVDDCVFCKIVKGEIPSTKVLENEKFIVIKDVNPEAEGHSLVIPKEHYENFLNLPKGLYIEFLETARSAAEKILSEVGATDFNMNTNNGKKAGQLVPHLHLHIIPRK